MSIFELCRLASCDLLSTLPRKARMVLTDLTVHEWRLQISLSMQPRLARPLNDTR